MSINRIIPAILLTVLSCKPAEVKPVERAASSFWRAHDAQKAYDAGITLCSIKSEATPNSDNTMGVCMWALAKFRKLMQGGEGLPKAYRESLTQCANGSYTTPKPNQNPAQEVCIWALNKAKDTFIGEK